MSTQRFSIGTQFQWQDKFYQVKRLLADSKVNIQEMESGEMQTVYFTTLLIALFADKLKFVGDGHVYEHPGSYMDLSDCPPHLLAIARHRLSIIEPLLQLPRQGRKKAIRNYVKELQGKQKEQPNILQNAISVASVYRWLKFYQESNGDLRSLLPDLERRGGRSNSRLHPEVEQIIQSVIDDHYYVRVNRTIDFLHWEIALRLEEVNRHRTPQEQLQLPSRATIDRRLAALDIEGKIIAKRGRLAARRELTQYEQGPQPTMPLERVEIDHTRTDLIVVDEQDMMPLGRMTLTFCLDVATRYPLGYYIGFEPPSYLSVMECLYHTIQPKENIKTHYDTEHNWLAHGIPYTLIIDNGKEFIGRDLQDACQLLGITLERMPVRMPEFKASVERMYGTLNTGLFHTLPGTTFSNIVQKGDYQSLKYACVTLNDLDKMLHIFLLDIYAEKFHRGLQGIPARCWEEAARDGFFPRVPSSGEELRILLGRIAYRTVQPYGIEIHSLRYNSPELTLLRTRLKHEDNKRVKIKYHPGDLGRIHAYDSFEKQYLEVPALAQEYAGGLSLWKHRVIRNHVLSQRQTVDLVSLGRAQRKIQEIVENSMSKKKLRTRSKIARWQESGKTLSLAGEGDQVAANDAQRQEPLELSSINLDVTLEDLEQEGWGIEPDFMSNNGRKQNE